MCCEHNLQNRSFAIWLFVQYQWWLNSTPITQQSLSRSLELRQIRRGQLGYYRCLARNEHGAKFSDICTVTIAYLDQFDKNPAKAQYRCA